MARRRRPEGQLDPLTVARIIDELYPMPESTYEQWGTNRQEALELRQRRTELAAEYGYTLLDLLRARVQAGPHRANGDAGHVNAGDHR